MFVTVDAVTHLLKSDGQWRDGHWGFFLDIRRLVPILAWLLRLYTLFFLLAGPLDLFNIVVILFIPVFWGEVSGDGIFKDSPLLLWSCKGKRFSHFPKTLVAQQKQLTVCVTWSSGEPTLLVFVRAGDVVPLVGANRLGGDILTDFPRVGPDLHFRTVSFDLTGHTNTKKITETDKTMLMRLRFKALLTDQPVNTVCIDLSEDKRHVIFDVRLAAQNGFDWGWTAAVNTCRWRHDQNHHMYEQKFPNGVYFHRILSISIRKNSSNIFIMLVFFLTQMTKNSNIIIILVIIRVDLWFKTKSKHLKM